MFGLGCAKGASKRKEGDSRADFASAQMATCSDGDSFYLDSEWTWIVDTFDGCYMDSGYTIEYIPWYFPDGVRVEGPGVYAEDFWGTPVSSNIGISILDV